MSEFIEEFDQEEVEEREAFEIKDLSTLGWAFQKLAEYQSKKDEIDNYAKAEIDRVKKWQEKEDAKIMDSINFFQSHIERYHFHRLMEDPKAKTISTPYGKSKSTTSKPVPKTVDETALLAHIKASGLSDYLKIEEKVTWGDLKKNLQVVERDEGLVAVDENGEIVPGVVIEPENTSFKSEVAK